MKIDPKNFSLNQETIEELLENYETNFTIQDYFLDHTTYEGSLDGPFIELYNVKIKGLEKGEKWGKEYLGLDMGGWERVEFRFYKGPKSKWMEPHALHLRVTMRFKKKKAAVARERVEVEDGFWDEFFVAAGRLISDFFTALCAMIIVDSLFPPKEGESTFGRDFLVGWAAIEFTHRKRRERYLELDEDR